MYYLVDTNVFLHAICDEIYTVASLCKENDQEMTITETILNELEPGYYLEIEDETAKAAYNAVHNLALGTMGIKAIRLVKLEDLFDEYASEIGLTVLSSDEWLRQIGHIK